MREFHGMSGTKIHRVWLTMKNRCSNKNNNSYEHYGARGIRVCEEWSNSFESFYNWCINNGYKEGLHIDRINNDGNYEPCNCKFSTVKENNNPLKRTVNKNNALGVTGVCYKKRDKVYEAKITINGKQVTLGYFKNLNDAIKARKEKEVEVFKI